MQLAQQSGIAQTLRFSRRQAATKPKACHPTLTSEVDVKLQGHSNGQCGKPADCAPLRVFRLTRRAVVAVGRALVILQVWSYALFSVIF